MFFLGRFAPCGGTLCAVVLGVLDCVFMVERNIKKLLLGKLKETGDDPEEVECHYFGHPLPGTPIPMMCSASSLPEGDLSVLSCISEKFIYKLVKTDTEIKIERSTRKRG